MNRLWQFKTEFLSIADIRNPYNMNGKEVSCYVRKVVLSYMYKLRKTNPARQRIHKVPLPKLR